MCRRPSWTAIVCPTISGKIDEARDHVRRTSFAPRRLSASIFLNSLGSMYGPFLVDRLMRYLLPRFRTMKRSVLLLRRVFLPYASLPHLVFGWPPTGALPSPPPWGWSRGFMTDPRTVGRMPR